MANEGVDCFSGLGVHVLETGGQEGETPDTTLRMSSALLINESIKKVKNRRQP